MTKIAHLFHIVPCWNSQVWQQQTGNSTNILTQKHMYKYEQFVKRCFVLFF